MIELALRSEVFENLSLHLDDVEMLRNAYIVQAITGPLVRFSNRGRYEPYVAKSWSQSDNTWTFKFQSGLECEDGQPIHPESFKKSFIRSLKRLGPEEIAQTPFASLEGMDEFFKTGSSEALAIVAGTESLELKFKRAVGKSLLEYLAMTPFAFLCDANFDEKGEWISGSRFISSGPYRVAEFDQGRHYCKLELRPKWPLAADAKINAVIITTRKASAIQTAASIDMTYGREKTLGAENIVNEVPRALISLRLGIGAKQFFAKRENRKALQQEVQAVLSKTKIPFENYHRADTFFFGQATGHEEAESVAYKVPAPKFSLVLRGQPKGMRPEVDFFQGIVIQALENLQWPYELMDKPLKGAKDYYSLEYDMAFDRSHVDATLDPDFVRILFMSNLGPRYQDPGGRVAKLLTDFENGRMPYRDFLVGFNAIISEEAAIIPLFHRGFSYAFSPNLDTNSISPLMSILRFEEIDLRSDATR